MQVLRLYDPSRRPPSWTDIIRDGEFAAFAKNLDTEAPSDHDGHPVAAVTDATCVLFDSLEDARRFCEERTQHNPSIRFDVFDSTGRVNPPLLTIVNPLRADRLDDNPRALRRRARLGYALILGSLPLFAFQYWGDTEGVFILPMFLGINLLIAGGRLLLMNVGSKDAERRRQERLSQVRSRSGNPDVR